MHCAKDYVLLFLLPNQISACEASLLKLLLLFSFIVIPFFINSEKKYLSVASTPYNI